VGAARRNPLSGLFVPEVRVLRLIHQAQRVERGGTWLGKRLGHLLRYRLAKTWGIHVHPKAQVGNIRLPHPTSIVIGAGSIVEDGVVISQQVTIGTKDDSHRNYPTVRRNARLYVGAMVLGPIEVGEGAIVGANSVVLSSVDPFTVVAGSPAKPVGSTSAATSRQPPAT